MNNLVQNIAAVREVLLKRHEELLDRALRAEHDLRGLSQPVERDSADYATQHQNDEALHVIATAASEELSHVAAALERIAQGTYGVCTRCSEEIEPARLIAVPYAQECGRCMSSEQSTK